jgi:hypothetical protein
VKRISRYLPLLFVLFCCVQFANAQSAFDFNIGFGAFQDKASTSQIDQNLNPCTGVGVAPPCVSTPALSGFVMGVGGDLMLWKKLGFGADVSFQPGKQDYVNLNASAGASGLSTLSLQSRVTLFDFDAIFQPINTKKVGVKLRGGIGGANIKFYESGSASNALVGNQNFSQYYGSSNHFQVNGGLGVQIYISEHVFLRPEFDIHYVRNLTQFGRNAITQEMVWLGYSFGDRP